MSIYEKLLKIQLELKAPKNQYNSFSNFYYRNTEDILEGLKPLLAKYNSTITISDNIEMLGNHYYVRAAVNFVDIENGEMISVSALAREEENRKGMDGSMLTACSSSYARKYALNGLFCIDDSKDVDFTSNNQPAKKDNKQENNKKSYKLSDGQVNRLLVIGSVAGYSAEQVLKRCKEKYNVDNFKDLTKEQYDEVCTKLENKKSH